MARRLSVLLILVGLVGTLGVSAEDDHGNTPLAATSISADGTLIAGCIEAPADLDYFLFNAVRGRSFVIQTSHLTPEMDTVIYLLGNDGQQILGVDDDSGGGPASRIEWSCPSSGTYFVMVRHAQALKGTGCYELSITPVQSDDHGDDLVTATPISTDGTPTSGYIETSGDADFFLFIAEGSWEYLIETTNLTPEMDTVIELYGTDGGTVLARDDDSGGERASQLSWVAPASGTYFVAVRHAQPAGKGGYELSVERVGYSDDHGNEPRSATSIRTDGTSLSGRIEVPGDVDLFTFSATADGEYTIATGDLSQGMDPVLTLYGPSGRAVLAEDDNSGGGRSAEIEWTAPTSGTYFVAVRHARPEGTGSYTLAITAVLQLQEVGHFNSSGYALDVWVDGETAYLVVGVFGLLILDVSDPTSPLEIGSHSTRGYARAIEVQGKYGYRADRGGGLVILDVSTPTRPEKVADYDTPGSTDDVAVEGGFAYLADNQGGLQVVDISNPSIPRGIGSWTTRGYAEGVHLANGYAYVATGDAGLEIIDVSDRQNPIGIGEIDLPRGEAHDVRVLGGYAYVASGYAGIHVIDVSDPSVPRLVGSYRTPGEATGLFLSGNNLYVADYTSGLLVLGLTDPISPQPIAQIDTPGRAVGVFVAEEYAYVADRENGLRIIRLF